MGVELVRLTRWCRHTCPPGLAVAEDSCQSRPGGAAGGAARWRGVLATTSHQGVRSGAPEDVASELGRTRHRYGGYDQKDHSYGEGDGFPERGARVCRMWDVWFRW